MGSSLSQQSSPYREFRIDMSSQRSFGFSIIDYFTGNVIKYLCRAGHKDRETELDDLQKAKVYIEKRIELYHDRT